MLEQKEFEERRVRYKRSLKAMEEKPGIKVIELVEILLEVNPTLPVVIQDGNWQFPIVAVVADAENGVRLYIASPAESRPVDGRDQADPGPAHGPRRSPADGITEMETRDNENEKQNESTL